MDTGKRFGGVGYHFEFTGQELEDLQEAVRAAQFRTFEQWNRWKSLAEVIGVHEPPPDKSS